MRQSLLRIRATREPVARQPPKRRNAGSGDEVNRHLTRPCRGGAHSSLTRLSASTEIQELNRGVFGEKGAALILGGCSGDFKSLV